jgi:serine/threonine-protein kinase RsbW
MREPLLAIVSTDPSVPVVSLKIPAKAEYITLSRLALTGLARWASLSDETLSDLKLALSEACSNSVRHAYRDGRDGFVEIH